MTTFAFLHEKLNIFDICNASDVTNVCGLVGADVQDGACGTDLYGKNKLHTWPRLEVQLPFILPPFRSASAVPLIIGQTATASRNCAVPVAVRTVINWPVGVAGLAPQNANSPWHVVNSAAEAADVIRASINKYFIRFTFWFLSRL